jgi:uncharacterized protein (DUF1810 family)
LSRLDRFRTAQSSRDSGFEAALDEIRAGRKRGHWIWYIFPQLAGLGASELSSLYAIGSRDEAVEFLQDHELRHRLLAMAGAVAAQLERGASIRILMGSDVDALKLVSSLTLFGHVAGEMDQVEHDAALGALAAAARTVLSAAASQGYPPCAHTLRTLETG